MTQQTAVEWFAEKTAELGYVSSDIFQQAKAMEKEQIKKAFEFGVADAYNFIEDEAEEYYNQTYNK